jgi:hypothetical protein
MEATYILFASSANGDFVLVSMSDKSWNLNIIMIASLQECRGYELPLGLFACVGRFDTEVHAFSAIFVLFPCTLQTLVPCRSPHHWF